MKRHLGPADYRAKLLKGITAKTTRHTVDNQLPPFVLINHAEELLQIPRSDPYFSAVYSILENSTVTWRENLSDTDRKDTTKPLLVNLTESQCQRLLFVLLDDISYDLRADFSELSSGFVPDILNISAGELFFLKEKVGLWRKYAVDSGEYIKAGPYFCIEEHNKPDYEWY